MSTEPGPRNMFAVYFVYIPYIIMSEVINIGLTNSCFYYIIIFLSLLTSFITFLT